MRYVRRVKRGDNALESLPDQSPLRQGLADNAMLAVVAGVAIRGRPLLERSRESPFGLANVVTGMTNAKELVHAGPKQRRNAKCGSEARLENRICRMTQHGAISR
jgi:hypothetical protein